MSIFLRPYQQSLLSDVRASVRSGAKRPLVVAPTGSGKTILMADIVRSALAKGSSALVLAPRRELIFQTSAKLESMRVPHGVLMAGEPRAMWESVQVASVPTLHRRMADGRMQLPRADVVLVDEAHLSLARTTMELIAAYPEAMVIGFTATPARSDGRGLGEVYDAMVEGPTVASLTADGFLVPARYFSGEKPDLSGVKVQGGDYQQAELGERCNTVKLVGDIVENWARIASDRRTVVFSVDVAHSRHLAERFRGIGVRAEHLDGHTPNEERAEILARLRSGETQVLCNCEVLTYGWDEPSISCAVMAKPTKSVARYLQMAGRVLRPDEGKRDCMILDHGGCVIEHGFVDDSFPWSLDGKGKIQDRIKAERKKPDPITCGDCGATFEPQRECPDCGAEQGGAYQRAIESHQADLQELDKARKAKMNRQWTGAEKGRFFGELKAIGKSRGYQAGWAARQYRNRFDVWPNAHKDHPAVEPSRETLAWVQSQLIRFAKRRAA